MHCKLNDLNAQLVFFVHTLNFSDFDISIVFSQLLIKFDLSSRPYGLVCI